MQHWTELRTALYIARHGSLSRAAAALSTHRATVLRHLKTLEAHYEIELFRRHAKGYVATEAGAELLRMTTAAERHFEELATELRDRRGALVGELRLTSPAILAPILMPAIARFRGTNPRMRVVYLAGSQPLRLDLGEADVAIRHGGEPKAKGEIVSVLANVDFALFAHRQYVEQFGAIESIDDLSGHRFVGAVFEPTSPLLYRWIDDHVAAENIVFRAPGPKVIEDALLQGIGITFFPIKRAEQYPELVQMCPAQKRWQKKLCAVTHESNHHRPRVQAFLEALTSEPFDFSSSVWRSSG